MLDFVIVGAGSAGCVVAKRLIEGGARVTLLEAGRHGPLSLFSKMPTALSIPMHLSAFNWGFKTLHQKHLNNREITCPRGKGPGGSSAMNGMVYVRGHPLDFDWLKVAPYFKKMENYNGQPCDLRGTDGPLHVKVGENALKTPLYESFLAAGAKAGYGRLRGDYNGVRQEGFGQMPATIFHSGPLRGQRCSTAAAYPVDITRGHAAKILFEDRTAVGVRCVDGAEFRGQVVLCAGAIGSPHLLQVSGIPCGQNLQDHLEVYLQFKTDAPSLAPYMSRKLQIGAEWVLTRRGLGATNHFEAGAFIRSKAGVQYPDIQIHFLPVAVSYDGQRMATEGDSFQLHVGCNRPKSRGTVTSVSDDIRVPPVIDFNYMSEEEDWADFYIALKLAREIVQHMDVSSEELTTTDDTTFLLNHLESAYHPCGTTSDITDDQGRVHGYENLRVIDASLFAHIPNGNLNAPTIMLAEKLSDAILGNTPPPVPQTALDHPHGWVDPNWRTRQRESDPIQ